MSLTEREKAVAGFAYTSGRNGDSMETMQVLIQIAEAAGELESPASVPKNGEN